MDAQPTLAEQLHRASEIMRAKCDEALARSLRAWTAPDHADRPGAAVLREAAIDEAARRLERKGRRR